MPDGVRSVRLDYDTRHLRGNVRDNVFSIAVPNRPSRSVPDRIVWLDERGSAVHIVTPEVFYSDLARR